MSSRRRHLSHGNKVLAGMTVPCTWRVPCFLLYFLGNEHRV